MADANELYVAAPTRDTYNVEEAVSFGNTFIWDLTEANPTNEDCVFCDEPEDTLEVSAFDLAIPLANGHVALKGALGMMRAGYMLGVTRQHVTSFAQLPTTVLAEIDASFRNAEEELCADLGYSDYIRLEHGSDNIKACGLGAGACVMHAHQHLIPNIGATAERMMEQEIDWQRLASYEDLASLKGEPYLYVGSKDGHYAAVDPQVRSQWGRRIVAEEDGHDEWDWALFSGALNLTQTRISQGMLPQGRMVVIRQDGQATFWPRIQPRGKGLYK
jgi:diadenosine tetraphosphate (Ap4A) HIT family hydrolase